MDVLERTEERAGVSCSFLPHSSPLAAESAEDALQSIQQRKTSATTNQDRAIQGSGMVWKKT